MFGRIVLIVLVATFLGWSLLTRTVGERRVGHSLRRPPGDTLWSIAAARYGGDPREGVWKLQRRNDLAGTMISPGERLVLP